MRALLLASPFVLAASCANPVVEACERYVSAFSALPCTEGLEPGIDCRAYESFPCDVSAYFECAIEAQRCEEDELFDGLNACAAKLACP